MQLPQWFLVANGARARLLSRVQDEPLQLVRAFGHVQSPVKPDDAGDDGGSRMRARGLPAGAFETQVRAHTRDPDHERRRFAHELARFIDREAREGHFATLSVFAPGPFLSDLTHELGAATVHRLAAAEDLDLTQAPLAELERRLANAVGC